MKVFNKWDINNIKIEDPGLKNCINLDPIIVPKNAGRNAYQFGKAKVNIVERFMGKLMVPGHKGKKHKLTSGHCGGKAVKKSKIVQEVFDIIEKKTKENPIKIFVKAIENASPREEIISIEYGGARYPQAVECAPSRRVDIALRQIVQGAYGKSFGKSRGIAEHLADEIIKAYNLDTSSNAIAKKLELERQADASR